MTPAYPRQVLWILCCCLLLLLGPGEARAEEARELLAESARLLSRGEIQRSLEVLQRARRSTKSPALLARIMLRTGINRAFLGHTAQARKDFVEALRHDPLVAPDTATIKPQVVQLFTKVKKRQRGKLFVFCDRLDAAVYLDGKRAGRLPLETSISIGWHLVELRSPDGKQRSASRVLVGVGGEISVNAHLGPSREGARAPAPGASAAGDPDVELTVEVGPEKQQPPTPASGATALTAPLPPPVTRAAPLYKKWWFWTLVGVAVAGTTVGIVAGTSGGGDELLPSGPDGTFTTDNYHKP